MSKTVRALPETLHLIVPIALREVMEHLLPHYQRQRGHAFQVVHMLNPEVPAYIDAGAVWDVAITNPNYVAQIIAAGHAVAKTHKPLGRAPLAFAKFGKAEGEPASARRAIADLLLGSGAIAITDVGTSGDMFRNLALELDVWEAIHNRVVGLEGGGPMRALLAGEVELAALPLTNIAPVPQVHIAGACPLALDVHIDLSICQHIGANDAARDFADWLLDPELDGQLEALGAYRFNF
ncbi:MAG: substrate-binding domain-containing protein [Pseudomonadota bacterium]